MPRDPEKAKARNARFLQRQKVKKFGPSAVGRDMRGRHGNHATGAANARWSGGRFITSHGYVAVRVPVDHPHAWGADETVRYAYEHIVVVVARIGRPLADNETVHHINGDKTDNSDENLELLTRTEHAKHHACERGRDEFGRFPLADFRVREFPNRQQERKRA